MAKLDSAKRYRFTVPAQDEYVQQWIDAQINISTSIRTLIREDIQKNGYTDVTCREVEQRPKVGRPSAAEVEKRRLQELQEMAHIQNDVSEDYADSYDKHVVASSVSVQKNVQPVNQAVNVPDASGVNFSSASNAEVDPNIAKLREMGIMD